MKRAVPIIRFLFLALCACAFLYPIVCTFTGSLVNVGTAVRVYGKRLILIPDQVSTDQYLMLLLGDNGYLDAFVYTLLLSFTIAAGNTVLCFFAAYVFARVRFPGRDALFFLILLGMMMPFQVTLLPNFLTIRALNLHDTRWALLLPNLFMPFGVYLMRQFILQLDSAQSASFRLDCRSTIKMLVLVILPQVTPAAAALFILSFAQAWNMVDQPLILLSDRSLMPLSVLLGEDFGGKTGLLFAASVVFMLPILTLYALFSDQLIEGMESLR
ncbi:MAG: carbohydrate ABC transporter permease [Christensenellaceae bacterium]|nr:carbohydrate ABC transporter permease [Christensenellaceae bacterium]